jgi:hypothetical protein
MTAIVLRKYHEITAAFASTDASRYVLQGAHYNAQKGVLEASDGKMAIRLPVETTDEKDMAPPLATGAGLPADCIIPSSLLQRAMKAVPNGNSLPCVQCARLDTTTPAGSGDPVVSLTTTDLDTTDTVKSKAILGTFPKLEQVWPQGDVAFEMAFDPEVLGRLCAYAKKHSGEKTRALKFVVRKDALDKLNGVIGAVEFSLHLEPAIAGDPPVKASGVIMPMRVS